MRVMIAQFNKTIGLSAPVGNLTHTESRMNGRKSVLFVDYDPQSQKALAALLQAEEYGIGYAGSAYEALERIRTHPPSLVVLPTNFLTKTGGWLLTEQIWETNHRVPVLLIADRDHPNSYQPPRGPHLLIKQPVNREHFMSSVNTLVSRFTPGRD